MSRIIAGSRGGQRLRTPAHDRTRPTSDRVREAVFSALATWADGADRAPAESLAGVAFADFFAGSGAVGLEAASRGAAPVLLVEADRRTARLAADNARTARLAARVRAERAERVLAESAPQPFDVLWFDPPYALETAALDDLVATAVGHGWLAEDGLLVVERSARSDAPQLAALGERWSRRYGETEIHYATAAR